MRHARLRLLLPAIALVAAACGGGGGDDDASGGNDAGPAPDQVVAQLRYEGGFQMIGADLTAVPAVTVYGDGRVLAAGSSPGNLVTYTLDDGDLETLIDDLRSYNLGTLGDRIEPGGDVVVADAPDTVITVDVGDGPVEVRANALGIGGVDFPDPLQAAAQRLQTLADRGQRDGEPWEPDGALLSVIGPGAGPGMGGSPSAWPADIEVPEGAASGTWQDPVTVALDADGLTALQQELPNPPATGSWRADDGNVYSVAWRPLLPHE